MFSMCLNSSTSESMQESDGDCRIYRTSGWCLVYVVFERKAREFQSCLYLILSLQSLICTTRKSLEHQGLNVHSNVTKNLTRASRSNTYSRDVEYQVFSLIFFSQQTGMHSNSSNPAHLLKYGNPYHSWICDICTSFFHVIRKNNSNTPTPQTHR